MHNACMANITVRNVPEGVRRAIAERAARQGQSMQEYLLGELRKLSRPTNAEVLDRARARVKATGTRVSAEEILAAIHADRR